MYFVVDADGVETELMPSGESVEVTVGPFASDTTILYRVFGGGERDYDSPLWNGYGEAGFKAAINQYNADHGGDWAWTVAGAEDDSIYTWHELEVEGCPAPVEETSDSHYTPWTPPKSIPTAPQCHDMAPALGVANVNVVRTSDTTALVQWSLHSGDQTHIIFGEAGTGWHHAALNVGTSGEAVINELIPGRTYDWAVIPMNGCAASGQSPTVYGI